MLPGENVGNELKDYKTYEIQLHRELMNSCRKYINHLSIVSILGILDICKQEAIELEKATNYAPNKEHDEVYNEENESS